MKSIFILLCWALLPWSSLRAQEVLIPSFEDEFSKYSHLHLPVSYSTLHGLSVGFSEGDVGHTDTSIQPVVNGSYEKVKRYINLEISSPHELKLEAADENSPYLLIEQRKWDLGLGLDHEWPLPISTLGLGIGVTYVKGSSYSSLRYLRSKHEPRASLRLPLSPEKIKDWRIGDTLAFVSKGSYIFNVFLGLGPFLHLGPEYMHSGKYLVELTMIDDEFLRIEIETIKTESIGLDFNSLPVVAQATKQKGHIQNLVYEFDLSHPESYESVKALLSGRMDLVNKAMMFSGGNIKVKTEMNVSGLLYSGSFGLPIIYVKSIGTGLFHHSGEINVKFGNEYIKSKLFTTSKIKENYSRGPLSRKNTETKATIVGLIKGERSLLSSVFSWSFASDKISHKTFYQHLRKIDGLFDTNVLQKLSLPTLHEGHLKAHFQLSLTGEDTLDLINASLSSDIKFKALVQLEKDFNHYGYKSFCKLRKYNECLDRYKNHIIASHADMVRNIRLLQENYQKRNPDGMTRHLNEVISNLFGSHYLTRAFVSSKKGLQKELHIEGEHIKKFKLAF